MYELVIVEKTIATKPQWLLGLLIPKRAPMGDPTVDDRVMMVISRFGTVEEARKALDTAIDDLTRQHRRANQDELLCQYNACPLSYQHRHVMNEYGDIEIVRVDDSPHPAGG